MTAFSWSSSATRRWWPHLGWPVDAITNLTAPDLLHHDVLNVGTWFAQRGLPLDPEATFVDLLMDLP